MLPTQRLENAVTHLTPEQYARVVAFAEALAAQSFEQTATEIRRRLARRWPAALRRRFRELTAKLESATLTAPEHEELAALAEESENVAVARAEAVSELVRHYRDVTPEKVFAVLNGYVLSAIQRHPPLDEP